MKKSLFIMIFASVVCLSNLAFADGVVGYQGNPVPINSISYDTDPSSTPVATPEPSTIALFSIAIVIALYLMRKKLSKLA